MRSCFDNFADDMDDTARITYQLMLLEHTMHNAPTLAERRKARMQYNRLATKLRRGGAVGGAMVERNRAAVAIPYESAWESARAAGRNARNNTQHSWFPQGWVTLVTSDKAFAKVLVQQGKPDVFSYEGLRKVSYLNGYGFSVKAPSHTVSEGKSFCEAAVEVLKQHGINAWCHVAWD